LANRAPTKCFAVFLYLAVFGTAATRADYLQLKVMRLILACYYLSNLTAFAHSQQQQTEQSDIDFIYTLLLVYILDSVVVYDLDCLCNYSNVIPDVAPV